jgi:ComF family protein
MISSTRELFHDFVALFFPTYCLGCKQVLLQQELWLCTTCFADLPQTYYHLHRNNPVAQKLYGKVPATYAMALYKFRTGSPVQHLIHQLKYGHQPVIGEMLGRIYGAQLVQQAWESPFECIVPVPLHQDRLRQRGYNQSDYFAKGMATLLDIPRYNHCVARIKNTNTQTKKNKIERYQNLMEAFRIVDPHVINSKHALLVDDVITTGATLEACALSLLSAGAKEISIATICVAD